MPEHAELAMSPHGAEPEVHSVRDGTRVNAQKYLAIRALAAEDHTPQQIAAALKMDARTVRAVLDRDDYQAETARTLLTTNAVRFAEDWIRASRKGSQKGKHVAARDALLHTGIITPLQSEQGSGARLTVVIGIQGQPVGQDSLSAVLQANSLQVSSLQVEE